MAAIRVGDSITVPGDMFGTVKFVGTVDGKKGTFVGVQLATQFSEKGKNSGDVDGKFYFKTTKAKSGIFLPLDKAIPRSPPAAPITPGSTLKAFNEGGRQAARTPTLPPPKFSQSIGPGARAGSPAMKSNLRRPSLPRPESPLRKAQTPQPSLASTRQPLATPKVRPSIGMAKSTIGVSPVNMRYTPGPNGTKGRFGSSLRMASEATPSRTPVAQLGPEMSFDEEEETSTPTPAPQSKKTQSLDATIRETEFRRLQETLSEKNKLLQEQASSLADMEKTLVELQSLLPEEDEEQRQQDSQKRQSDNLEVQHLRMILKEKNDRISSLTAEFDNHRSDFRSTIDTLELASTETERVYEQRVDELLDRVRELEEGGEDVESVADQLKGLEELVQELEEGLEDARRGEAEARAESEFLRGEVERLRAELKQVRGRTKSASYEERSPSDEGTPALPDNRDSVRSREAKDDEIRGLKAIIHSLNRDSMVSSARMSVAPSAESPNGVNGKHNSIGVPMLPSGLPHRDSDPEQVDRLQKQIKTLEALVGKKIEREEELEKELNQARMSMLPPPLPPVPIRRISTDPPHSNRLSDRTIVPDNKWKHTSGPPPENELPRPRTAGSASAPSSSIQPNPLIDSFPIPGSPAKHLSSQSDLQTQDQDVGRTESRATQRTDTSTGSATLWCEICECGGHDILTCTNMFGTKQQKHQKNASQSTNGSRSQRMGKDVVESALGSLNGTINGDSNGNVNGHQRNFSARSGSSVEQAKVAPLAFGGAMTLKDMSVPSSPDQEQEQEQGGPVQASHQLSSLDHDAKVVAGRESGVVDENKWCALCERDGHDSFDCPFEEELVM